MRNFWNHLVKDFNISLNLDQKILDGMLKATTKARVMEQLYWMEKNIDALNTQMSILNRNLSSLFHLFSNISSHVQENKNVIFQYEVKGKDDICFLEIKWADVKITLSEASRHFFEESVLKDLLNVMDKRIKHKLIEPYFNKVTSVRVMPSIPVTSLLEVTLNV